MTKTNSNNQKEELTSEQRQLTLEELSRVTGGVNQPHHTNHH